MKWLTFSEVVTDVTSKFEKIKTSDYKTQGKYKIIDQGKEPIAGYTDNINLVNNRLNPVVIFGDHTRIFKYEDQPIALGADGAKALWINPKVGVPQYVYYYLRSIKIKEAGYSRHFKFLKEVEIPIPFKDDSPDFDSQIRIAQLLGKVEGLIAQRKQHLQQLDDLLKSVFLEMFGDPVKNNKGWDLGLIIDHCDVKGGKRIPKGEKLVTEDTGYPYIKAGNIKNGIVTTNDMEYVTPEVRKTISRYTVDAGDVCITVVGANIGDVGIVPTELHKASLTENANKLLIKNKKTLNNHYLAHYLMSNYVQQQIENSIRAAGVPKLAIFRIEQMLLLLPPISLQLKFEKAKKIIESLMLCYKNSLIDLEALYGALSQQAFKCELDLSRVHIPNEIAKQIAEEILPDNQQKASTENSFNEYAHISNLISQLSISPPSSLIEQQGNTEAWLDAYIQYVKDNKKPLDIKLFLQVCSEKWNEQYQFGGGRVVENLYDKMKEKIFEKLHKAKLMQEFDEENNAIKLRLATQGT